MMKYLLLLYYIIIGGGNKELDYLKCNINFCLINYVILICFKVFFFLDIIVLNMNFSKQQNKTVL